MEITNYGVGYNPPMNPPMVGGYNRPGCAAGGGRIIIEYPIPRGSIGTGNPALGNPPLGNQVGNQAPQPPTTGAVESIKELLQSFLQEMKSMLTGLFDSLNKNVLGDGLLGQVVGKLPELLKGAGSWFTGGLAGLFK